MNEGLERSRRIEFYLPSGSTDPQLMIQCKHNPMPESALRIEQLSHMMPSLLIAGPKPVPSPNAIHATSIAQTRKITHLRKPLGSSSQMRCPEQPSTLRMAAALVPLHITPHTKRFSTSRMRTLIRLLTRMRVRVDLQTTRPTESFIASRAHVPILCLWEDGLGILVDVVVVLPDVTVGLAWHTLHGLHWQWRLLWWEV